MAESDTSSRVGWLLRILVSTGILAALAWVVDLGGLLEALRLIPWEAFALAFVLNLCGSILVPALQTRLALGVTRLQIGFLRLVGINLMVRFYVLVLPRPVAVGIRWWEYRQGGSKTPGSEAAALMAFERMVQATILTGALVAFVFLEREALAEVGGAIFMLGAAAFLATSVGLATFLWRPAARIASSASRRLPAFMRAPAERLLQAVSTYPGLPTSRVVGILGLGFAYFVLFVLSFLVLLRALGVQLGFSEIAWIRSMVFLLTVVPASVAGIGVREAGFVGFLHLYGVAEETALAAALAALAVQVAIGFLGAGVALSRQWGRRASDWSQKAVAPSGGTHCNRLQDVHVTGKEGTEQAQDPDG